ncbi:MAG: metal-sulfur cluster assembly factor [Acidobacteriia bacterium]|nr:metal-sulfur cluster assembly factor [Methyloceanibacter sp.]MCL6490239.1 metal-sulfur cluster assembly factor [Terriglobia bacterium]
MREDAPLPTEASVREALHDVIDPELGFNIVDLGLVYDVNIDGRVVDVRMTMTTPGCPAQGFIVSGVEERLAQEEGITGVFVDVVWDPPWSPRMMSPVAKAHFRIREE